MLYAHILGFSHFCIFFLMLTLAAIYCWNQDLKWLLLPPTHPSTHQTFFIAETQALTFHCKCSTFFKFVLLLSISSISISITIYLYKYIYIHLHLLVYQKHKCSMNIITSHLTINFWWYEL